MPVALTNCMKPEFEEVARARYGVNFKSKFSLLNSWSIRLMICNTNWSWRRSSPILKMAGYSVPCSVTKVNLDGMREDLKRVAFSALIPQIEMLGSRGRGRGSKDAMLLLPSPSPSPSPLARSSLSLSIFLVRSPRPAVAVSTSLARLLTKACWRSRVARCGDCSRKRSRIARYRTKDSGFTVSASSHSICRYQYR